VHPPAVHRSGSTPTCRGFGHFDGFYSAASQYFNHTVGRVGYDYHTDFATDNDAFGVYTTHKVTADVQKWIEREARDHELSGPALDADGRQSTEKAPFKSFACVSVTRLQSLLWNVRVLLTHFRKSV
jgi:hypothetical protein